MTFSGRTTRRRSSKPRASYAPDRLAQSLGEIIDALGIRGTAAIGNSMGGYLLMRLALLDPGAMKRLVNLHSPGLPTTVIINRSGVAVKGFDGPLTYAQMKAAIAPLFRAQV